MGHVLDYVLDHMLDYMLGSDARSHDYKSCDHGVTIAFFFGMSFNKQVIIKKKLFATT